MHPQIANPRSAIPRPKKKSENPAPTGPIVIASGPALTEQDVAAVERGLKATLPDDYRAFILKHNGGELLPLGPGISNLLPHGKVSDRSRSRFDEFVFIYKTNCPLLPQRMIPIGEELDHWIYCLSLSGPDRGAVYKWEPPDFMEPPEEGEELQPDEECLTREADSFTDFLAAVAARCLQEGRKKQPMPDWVAAILREDLPWLTEWLHSGADPLGETYGDSVSPIQLAIGERRQPVVELFLAHGGKPVVNEAFESALAEQKFDVAASLLKHVDRPNIERAMIDFVRETDFVRQILDAGADPNCEPDFEFYTRRPLHAAAERNAPETVKLLLGRGAKPGAWSRGADPSMALHHAIKNQDLDLTKLLLEAGEDLYAPPPGHDRPAVDRAKELLRKAVPTRERKRWGDSDAMAVSIFGMHVGKPAIDELRLTRNPTFIQAVQAHAASLGQRPHAA